MTTPSPDDRFAPFDVVPSVRHYYDRTTLDAAIADTIEKIEEWDYTTDAHGYCHERPYLILLVNALRSGGQRDNTG